MGGSGVKGLKEYVLYYPGQVVKLFITLCYHVGQVLREKTKRLRLTGHSI